MPSTDRYVVTFNSISYLGPAGEWRSARRGEVVELGDETATRQLELGAIRPANEDDGEPVSVVPGHVRVPGPTRPPADPAEAPKPVAIADVDTGLRAREEMARLYGSGEVDPSLMPALEAFYADRRAHAAPRWIRRWRSRSRGERNTMIYNAD